MTAVAPLLVTARLELWRPDAGDLAGMVALVAHEETRRHLGPGRGEPDREFDRLLRNAGSWALYGYGNFLMRRPGERAIVGMCGMFHSWRGFALMNDVVEAGWIVRHDHAGSGLAREAMTAALAWFDAAHDPCPIMCMIERGNRASERLAATLGFLACGEHVLEDGATVGLYRRA